MADLRPALPGPTPGSSTTHSTSASTPDLSSSAISDDNNFESYDDLQPDPDAMIGTRRASQAAQALAAATPFTPSAARLAAELEKTTPADARSKRHSMQIRVERSRGRYVLTADDPIIREILRKGMQREEEDNAAAQGKKPRNRIRDLVFTRQFTTFDRQNPAASDSPFFGFFTLFWIGMGLLLLQVCMRNWREHGTIWGSNEIIAMMHSRDLVVFGLTDGVMFLACFEGVLFQWAVKAGWINWSRSGWALQNLWQSAYLGGVIGWAYFREWPWTHTVFVVLHGLVFVMKQHSYAFYNGYLSGVYRRKALLERKLKQLEALEPLRSPTTDSPTSATTSGFASSLSPTRPSLGPRTSTNLLAESSSITAIAKAIEKNAALTDQQLAHFTSIIQADIADLTKELQGKASSPARGYPHNLTVFNMAEYICLPTLVYELEYPRQDAINWWYVLEKTAATFGVLMIMMTISQAYIYPTVMRTLAMKEAGLPMAARVAEYPFVVSDLLFPLLIEQLLTWYLIWECILNVLAELTRFADRGFYGAWWNSVTWDQYARDWNRPVHTFLLRHVYHSSISTFHLSRNAATLVTFVLSALVHEMVMAILFKKVRGYLFWMQLAQLPLVAVSRSPLLKNRVVLGNTTFWIGLFVGPSVLMSLYLVV